MSSDDEERREKLGYRSDYQSLGTPGTEHQISGSVPAELAHAVSTGEVCARCVYFERAQGQKLMEAQRFVERLVREQDWKVKYLASPLNDLGICGAHSSGRGGADETITGAMHRSCDQFRPNKGLVSLSRKFGGT